MSNSGEYSAHDVEVLLERIAALEQEILTAKHELKNRRDDSIVAQASLHHANSEIAALRTLTERQQSRLAKAKILVERDAEIRGRVADLREHAVRLQTTTVDLVNRLRQNKVELDRLRPLPAENESLRAALEEANQRNQQSLLALETLTDEQNSLRVSLEEANQRNQQSLLALETLTDEHDSLRVSLEDADQLLSESRAELETLRPLVAENESLHAALEVAEELLEEADRLLDDKHSELETLRATLSEADRLLADSHSELETLRPLPAEIEALQASLGVADELLDAKESELETLRPLVEEKATLQSALATTDQELTDTRAELETVRTTLEDSDQLLAESRIELDKLRPLALENPRLRTTAEEALQRLRESRAEVETLRPLTDQNASLRSALEEAHQRLDDSERAASTARQMAELANREVARARAETAELHEKYSQVFSSRSWRWTRILRREWPGKAQLAPPPAPAAGATVAPYGTTRIAVVLHVFYPELWPVLADQLSNLQFTTPDIFVSLSKGSADHLLDDIQLRFPGAVVRVVPNRGRDMAPFFGFVNDGLLDGYSAILKLHTKRSRHREDGDAWRSALLHGLLPSPDRARYFAELVSFEPSIGCIVPAGNDLAVGTSPNDPKLRSVLRRIGVAADPISHRFPAGSMYWLDGRLTHLLKSLAIDIDSDFEEERGQKDATTAHALERAIGVLLAERGQRIAIAETVHAAPPAPVSHARLKLVARVPAATDLSVTLGQGSSWTVFDGCLIAACPAGASDMEQVVSQLLAANDGLPTALEWQVSATREDEWPAVIEAALGAIARLGDRWLRIDGAPLLAIRDVPTDAGASLATTARSAAARLGVGPIHLTAVDQAADQLGESGADSVLGDVGNAAPAESRAFPLVPMTSPAALRGAIFAACTALSARGADQEALLGVDFGPGGASLTPVAVEAIVSGAGVRRVEGLQR